VMMPPSLVGVKRQAVFGARRAPLATVSAALYLGFSRLTPVSDLVPPLRRIVEEEPYPRR